MRIANSFVALGRTGAASKKTLLLAATALIGAAMPAFAGDPGPIMTPPLTMPAAAAPAVTPITSSTPAMTPPPALDAMAEPAKPAEGDNLKKNVNDMENKASDSAKGMIKRLDGAPGDTLTLEDLNAARQTVARIDAVIEVEKRLAELDKLRNDRVAAHTPPTPPAALTNAIPASALAPPPSFNSFSPPPVPVKVVKPPHVTGQGIEISRISGTDGHYVALLKLSDGELKPVRVGDEVSGKTIVRFISASSVGLEDEGEARTLHARNVDTVYSALR